MIDSAPTARAWRGLADLRPDVELTLSHSCSDRNDLDDLVQETLLRAARFRGGLKDPASLRPWVLRIAWNVMREFRRGRGRRRCVEVPQEFFHELEGRELAPGGEPLPERLSVGERVFESDDLLSLLAEACRALAPRERDLLDAYYLEGADCREVGDRLGLGAHSVKMRLFRLRRRLKRTLAVRAAERSTPRVPLREVVA